MAASRAIKQTFSIVIVLLISAQVEGQTIAVNPTSLAATNGDQNIIINCSAQVPPSHSITWAYFPHGSPTGAPIFSSLNNQTINTGNFSVALYNYMSGGVQYTAADLTIKLANPGLAVYYDCALPPSFTKATSSLVVLDPVECPAMDETDYAAGTLVNISCSVNFYFYPKEETVQRAPTINIYRGDTGVAVPGVVTSANDTTSVATASITLAIEDDGVEFFCIVSYPVGGPEYSDNCSVPYFVLHEVTEIGFSPPSSVANPTTVPVGSQINCTANGRPEPTIVWYDDQENMLEEGPQLTVTQEMQSRPQPVMVIAIANNSIDGGLKYASVEANYTFFVGDAPPPQVQSAGVEAWVIAVAVIVPIVVLAAIGIAIFFIVRHRKKKAAKKKTTNGSTNRPTTTTTTNSIYTPVATEITYTTPNRPPPTSAPRNAGGAPPGPDSRNGVGFGDLGVQSHGGSTQAMNAYPTRNSLHGSNQAIGMGVSMNPNPGYNVRASNPVLNASVVSNSRPNYPYNGGSNSNLNVSINTNPNPLAAVPVSGYGRQPSIASSSGRSHASSYNGAIPGMEANRYTNDLSSMHGSEV